MMNLTKTVFLASGVCYVSSDIHAVSAGVEAGEVEILTANPAIWYKHYKYMWLITF